MRNPSLLRLPPPAPSFEGLEGLRVLVAVDDACVRWTLCGWLACLGVCLRQVDSGAAALEALADGAPFDLALVDLRIAMPDGFFLAATLHALGVPTPVVILQDHHPRTRRTR
jgi:two-component system, NtrC family, nitrogen regulation response regulator GlnG